LAKLMARPSNLLILDEPTNDLDVETLDLLQDVLGEYDGTVLLVSHDRDFIDRIATATVAMEGNGRATAYPGGWSDYAAQRPEALAAAAKAAKSATPPKDQPKPSKNTGLSFTERKRLDDLPPIIARLEAEIVKLEEFLAVPDLYSKDPVKFKKGTEALTERQIALQAAEAEWLALEERA
ncbi:MAG: ABC transporter ATP-binding protein, partial [Pseudorhodobacter sp.]|nr:ABC transporter ATP-binding protein [Pseudorhodobacter sp.]